MLSSSERFVAMLTHRAPRIAAHAISAELPQCAPLMIASIGEARPSTSRKAPSAFSREQKIWSSLCLWAVWASRRHPSGMML